MTLRQVPPVLVTMLTLTCGLAAIEATRVGDWALTLRLILGAAVADGTDGMLARRLHAVSALGGQLDSLADIIAFGVAPALLFSTYYVGAPAGVRFGVALAFVLAGAYRLARFHAQPTHGAFCGLPITAAGPLFALAVAGPFGVATWQAALGGIGLALLMVSRHPFPKLPRSRYWLRPAVIAAALPVALWPQLETLAIAAAAALGAYLVWGLVRPTVEGIPGIGIKENAEVREAGRPRV